MDNTQKIVLGVAVATLVIAVIFFFFSGKSNDEHMKTQEPSAKQVQQQPRQQPRQHHQQLPPRQASGGEVSEKVLVMFFAPWCGHCKNMGPAWDELAQNFDGYNGVKIVKVNGQENPQICQIHGVGGFPTIKYCPGGIQNPDGITYEGDRSVSSLAQFLQQHA